MIENNHHRLFFGLGGLIVDIIARLTGQILLARFLKPLLVYFASKAKIVRVSFIVAKVPT